jgi:hypothetical protein
VPARRSPIRTRADAQTRAAADAIVAKDFDRALALRDPEFIEMLVAFYATSRLDDEGRAPTKDVRVVCPSMPRAPC